jgi:lysozyme
MTRDNDKIIEMLKRHEGVVKNNDRHVVYKCSEGFWTLGVGRNVDSNGGLGISDDEVEYMLSNDVDRVIAELGKSFPWFSDIDCVRADAMIDICFNLGMPRLKGFAKALSAMASEDYETAAYEFSDSAWFKQVGKRAQTIVEMIRYGKYPDLP